MRGKKARELRKEALLTGVKNVRAEYRRRKKRNRKGGG